MRPTESKGQSQEYTSGRRGGGGGVRLKSHIGVRFK